MTFHVTEETKATIERMAEHGLGMRAVATAIGCHRNTIRNNKELYAIYQKSLSETRKNIAKTAIERALAGGDERETASTKMLMFLINTRFRFTDIKLEGSYEEKMQQLQNHLADNEITLNEYAKLSETLCKQYQVEEIEEIKRRLDEMEKSKQ